MPAWARNAFGTRPSMIQQILGQTSDAAYVVLAETNHHSKPVTDFMYRSTGEDRALKDAGISQIFVEADHGLNAIVRSYMHSEMNDGEFIDAYIRRVTDTVPSLKISDYSPPEMVMPLVNGARRYIDLMDRCKAQNVDIIFIDRRIGGYQMDLGVVELNIKKRLRDADQDFASIITQNKTQGRAIVIVGAAHTYYQGSLPDLLRQSGARTKIVHVLDAIGSETDNFLQKNHAMDIAPDLVVDLEKRKIMRPHPDYGHRISTQDDKFRAEIF